MARKKPTSMPVKTPNIYKLKLFFLFMLCYLILYVCPNYYPLWSVSTLPLLPIDLAIPFVPWTFYIYTSDYTFFFFVILLIQDKLRFDSFARMLFLTLLICGIFFIFFPTTYPRPEYPPNDSTLLSFLMNLVASVDSPSNCLPSMHVALTCSATMGIKHMGKKYFYFFGIWSLLVILSTLTTKQHYIVDILGGLFVTLLVYKIETNYISTRLLKRQLSRPTK